MIPYAEGLVPQITPGSVSFIVLSCFAMLLANQIIFNKRSRRYSKTPTYRFLPFLLIVNTVMTRQMKIPKITMESVITIMAIVTLLFKAAGK